MSLLRSEEQAETIRFSSASQPRPAGFPYGKLRPLPKDAIGNWQSAIGNDSDVAEKARRKGYCATSAGKAHPLELAK